MNLIVYRELTHELFAFVSDWSACSADEEREAWRRRAFDFLGRFDATDAARAKESDRQLRTLAVQEFQATLLIPQPLQGMASVAVPYSSMQRSSGYNKSPARAVRLARAARSAMRRGYF